jgi:hypothetical protein
MRLWLREQPCAADPNEYCARTEEEHGDLEVSGKLAGEFQ